MKIKKTTLTGLVVAAIVLFCVVAIVRQRQYQYGLQQRILNASFVKIQPKQGGVEFTPRRRLHSATFMDLKPVLLPVGSTFEFRDVEVYGSYTIKDIESDGVIIAYDAEGHDPAAVRRGSGTIKLNFR